MSIRELSGLFDAFSRYFAVQEPEDGGEASRVRLMRRKRPAPRETGQRKRRAPSPELRGPSAGLHAAPLARVARHQGRQTRGSQLVLGSAGDMPSGSSGSDQTAAPARKVIRPPRAARQPKRIETRLMSPDFGPPPPAFSPPPGTSSDEVIRAPPICSRPPASLDMIPETPRPCSSTPPPPVYGPPTPPVAKEDLRLEGGLGETVAVSLAKADGMNAEDGFVEEEQEEQEEQEEIKELLLPPTPPDCVVPERSSPDASVERSPPSAPQAPFVFPLPLPPLPTGSSAADASSFYQPVLATQTIPASPERSVYALSKPGKRQSRPSQKLQESQSSESAFQSVGLADSLDRSPPSKKARSVSVSAAAAIPLAPRPLFPIADLPTIHAPHLDPLAPQPNPPPPSIVDPVKQVLPTKRTTVRKGVKRAEYVADKRTWVLPERDLEMKAGFPPIWCVGRQELCESLPYFKAYQGGHYDLGEVAWGYLLDGFASPLDRMEARGRIIISHGGGCSEGEGDNYRLKEDQRRDNVRVRALINCHRTKSPVALLAGQNYAHFPYLQTIGVRYAVLGYYFVRDVWVEAEAGKDENCFTRFKFLFEWAPSQGVPWFDSVIGPLPEPGQPPSPPLDLHQDDTRLQSEQIYCPECSQWAPHVFEEDVSCYNEACTAFFKLRTGERPSPLHLHYRPSFLQPLAASAWPNLVPQSLFPTALQELAHQPADYSRSAWRGYHCTHCGRLSSRSDWQALACDGCGCSVDMTVRVFPDAKELQRGVKRMEPAIEEGLGVTMKPLEGVPGWQGFTIDVAEDTRVHHLWPIGSLERENELFRQYQGEEAGKLFKRNTLSMHRLPGSYLCSQFSFNAGEEYNHVVNVETVPFDRPISAPDTVAFAFASPLADPELSRSSNDQLLPSPPSSTIEETRTAPSCVREACEHLSDIAQLVCVPTAEVATGFNEVLSIAYMEGGKMSYHDDGEQGLGPIVASLSLGADAAMLFRRKQLKKSRAKGAPVIDAREKPSTKPLIKLQLRQGDVTIMEGRGVQRDLDHMVEPVSLRFAATARFIGPEHKTRSTVPVISTRGSVCPPGYRRIPTPPLPPCPAQLPPPLPKVKKPRNPRVIKPKVPSPELAAPAPEIQLGAEEVPPFAPGLVWKEAEMALPPSSPKQPQPHQAPPSPGPTPALFRWSFPTFPDHVPTFSAVQGSPPSTERPFLHSPIAVTPSTYERVHTRSELQMQGLSDDRQQHCHTSRGHWTSHDLPPSLPPRPPASHFSSNTAHQGSPPRPWGAQDYAACPYTHTPRHSRPSTPVSAPFSSRPTAGFTFQPQNAPPKSRQDLAVELAVRNARSARGEPACKLDPRWQMGRVVAGDR